MYVRFLCFPVLLAALTTVAACSSTGNPNGPSDPPPPPNVVNYTAIGASDAIGFGSSSVCLPFTACPNGKGYVQLLEKRLKADGKTVNLLNLGLPGGVLGPEIQNIGNQLGRGILTNFLDNEVPFVQTDATLVTVFAGGNDVNTVGAAIENGMAGVDSIGYLAARADNFGRDLKKMMDGIKGRAPHARVVVLNLPNLAGLPYASGYSLAKKKALQTIAVRFSAEINKLTSQGATVVDIMCDGGFYQASRYSSDGFHPNDAGYSRMADVTYPPASSGSGPLPLGDCSFMRLY
jgi:lysophospholipase L1-like esterase